MRGMFKNVCRGMLLIASLVVCVPQSATATQAGNESVTATEMEDVTTTGLSIDETTVKSTYKAGEGTVTWTPAVKDSSGNVTSPAVLTLNNATITTEDTSALFLLAECDTQIKVIGNNKLTCVNGVSIDLYGGEETQYLFTINGGGTMEVETCYGDTPFSVRGSLKMSNVTLSTPLLGTRLPDGDYVVPGGISVAKYLELDNVTLSTPEIYVNGPYYQKSGLVQGVDWMFVDSVQLDKGATLNASEVFVKLLKDMQLSGTLNGVIYPDDSEKCTAYGNVTISKHSEQIFESVSEGVFEVAAGATVTVPADITLDLSKVTLVCNGSIVEEGIVKLPSGTTAEDIAKMNIIGDGAVVVVGSTDEEESQVYTTSGTKLNVVASLDFTNVGSGDGQTTATGAGYTWDAATKTLTLNGAYIDGSLNIPAGSKVVVTGINIVTGDVMVAGEVSDAFTLSGEGKLNSVSKKYVSHIYGEPKFVWTKNTDGYTAKAQFTCQGGEDTQTMDATVTEIARSTDGKATYEAKATFNGKDYVENKTASLPLSKLVGVSIVDIKSKSVYKVTKATAKGGTVEYVKPTKKSVKTVTIPKTITINGLTYKVTSISAKAFKGYKKLTTVKIGNNVKTIGKEAFSGCKKLKTVKLGSKVTTIGDKAFYKCVKLTSITIPSKVNKIGKSAFEKCKRLKTVTIKTKKLTAKKVGAKAFKGIKSTATIKVPKKKYKAYKAMLYKKGVSRKTKFKKI